MRRSNPYFNMIAQRRMRLIPRYFWDVHLFDLMRATDTAQLVDVKDFPDTLPNREHSVLYMSSWTSVIRQSCRIAMSLMGRSFERPQLLIDVGCGKGKAAIVWAEECIRLSWPTFVIGLDFNPELLAVARANLRRSKVQDCVEFCEADASRFPVDLLRHSNILYLYNPFDEIVMERMLISTAGMIDLIVYCNPVHEELLVAAGYEQVHGIRSWHPAGRVHFFRPRVRSRASSPRPYPPSN